MKNNVYVRSDRSIKTISLTRIFVLLPLIIYGFYKNGIYLYINHLTNIFGLFKPLIFIILGGLIGILVNIIYEYFIKNNKDNLIDIIFSSFHMEYGILIGCIISINTNLLLFISVTFIILMLSKFVKNRINVMCLIFIIIYILQSKLFSGFSYYNLYESSRVFDLNIMDYLMGRSAGGIACTHIILLFISFILLYLTNNTKSNITISSIIVLLILFIFYSIISNNSILVLLFNNSYMFIMTFIETDYITSSYSINGMILFGILVGILTFLFYFINPVLSPYISILIVSLLNNLIDRLSNKLS